jgi:5'-methylthioinosine phosphorylase
MSATIGILGGTGLQELTGFKLLSEDSVQNKYGKPSAPLATLTIDGIKTIFLSRHGTPHKIPPHKVNYRANIYAFKNAGVENIISINAVGGITKKAAPGRIILPDQIIDYTWSRKHTFFEDDLDSVVHVDFTSPYSDTLRDKVITVSDLTGINLIKHGTYAATQGPRLETAAEILRLEHDGCDIVGMTGMPEASLARELKINYVSICLVVNWAAGKSDELITMDSIQRHIDTGMNKILEVLKELVKII